MIKTKANLARCFDSLNVGHPLIDWWLLLPRLFGRDGKLDARCVKATSQPLPPPSTAAFCRTPV